MKTISLIMFLFIQFSVLAQDSGFVTTERVVEPDQVRIVSRLIGRLDWGYDSYYEIDLLIDNERVASATEIPDRTRAKLDLLNVIIKKAKSERKYLIVDTMSFSWEKEKALRISDQDLPEPIVEVQRDREHCIFCQGQVDQPRSNWFSDFLNRVAKK